MSVIDLIQLTLIGGLLGLCLSLQSRLNAQSEWMMNHSGWLKAHSNWLKALTVLHKLDLPDDAGHHLLASLSGTPEDTINVSMNISDNKWCEE